MLDGSRFADCSSGQMGEGFYEKYKVRRDTLETHQKTAFIFPHKSLLIGGFLLIIIIIASLVMFIA